MRKIPFIVKERLEKVFERPFKDDGNDYVALCPLHQEKTPSFYVQKESGVYHCFGCGAKGHIRTLVMVREGVDEEDAHKLLGTTQEDKVNDWFIQYNFKPKDPQTFPESWLAPFKKEIHKYVIRRGLTENTLRGVGSLYDHHSKRQVFPHRNREGKLVGAIGRACTNREPKWWFYWGYEKGRFLYRGPNSEYTSEERRKIVWIVEGVFDVLWLSQHGIPAVATLGSKPTKTQIQEIKDNYSTVVLGYDNDAAGIEGSRYLYSELKDTVNCLIPVWIHDENDVMDVSNPRKIKLLTPVQFAMRNVLRSLVPAPD